MSRQCATPEDILSVRITAAFCRPAALAGPAEPCSTSVAHKMPAAAASRRLLRLTPTDVAPARRYCASRTLALRTFSSILSVAPVSSHGHHLAATDLRRRVRGGGWIARSRMLQPPRFHELLSVRVFRARELCHVVRDRLNRKQKRIDGSADGLRVCEGSGRLIGLDLGVQCREG